VALAGGDIVAQRTVEAEDGMQLAPLRVERVPLEVAVDEPARAVFAARRVGGWALPGAVRGVVQRGASEPVSKAAARGVYAALAAAV